MKLQGGYLPNIPGRPSAVVEDIAVPAGLELPLNRDGLQYTPAVNDGATVAFGAPLAWAATAGGRIALPSPAAGTVLITPAGRNTEPHISLQVTHQHVVATGPAHTVEKTTPETLRRALATGGIWPLIRSSRTGGMPPLDGSEIPARIIVNFIVAEPFRTRGKTVLRAGHDQVIAGLRFLPRLMADYGKIHLILTELSDPVAVAVQKQTAGDAWIRIEEVPVRYPVEHPRVLCRALRRRDRALQPSEMIWVMDVQAVQAIGACMAEGIPLHERIVAIGGPAINAPRHVRARIGTPLARLIPPDSLGESSLILRGGLFKGTPADPATTAIDTQDDGFFAMPRTAEREFMGFVAAGFDRTSIVPCFGSALTGAQDRHLSASLRGERRPCVACGLCEKVCPAGLLPQVLHRYLYRDALDEAQAAGLDLCVDCGLCSYVCPSKIELRQQFSEAKARLREEQDHAAAVRDLQG